MQREQVVVEALLVLGGMTLLSWWVENYTTWLGPYGTPSDVYHLVILIATLYTTFIVFEVFVHQRYRGLAEE